MSYFVRNKFTKDRLQKTNIYLNAGGEILHARPTVPLTPCRTHSTLDTTDVRTHWAQLLLFNLPLQPLNLTAQVGNDACVLGNVIGDIKKIALYLSGRERKRKINMNVRSTWFPYAPDVAK